MLKDYERLDDLLDHLHQVAAEAPPVPRVLSRPRAAYGHIDSPIGPLFIAVTEKGVTEIGFAGQKSDADFRDQLEDRGLRPIPDATAIERVAGQLREYFAGRRNRFQVPLDFYGVTPFTRSVLDATAEIPFGQVRTYRQIAQQVGKPGATRAVGNALNRNPIAVIVPCHRIIRSDSSLGGYGGGPEIKQRLLSLEGVSFS
jgi:O-6-methylguanine DNA methyltransferase